jgi:hypothetical protein
MSDIADPHDDTQGLRSDSGDPNRDRADLLNQPPTQADDEAIAEHTADADSDASDPYDDHDAPTAAQ